MKNFSVTIIDDQNLLTLEEICRATHSQETLILELINDHIIQPLGASQKEWQFDHVCLKRVRLARNFYYDLEINLTGIGLLLDMLERIETLENQTKK